MPKASPMPGRCWTLRMDGSKNSSRLKRGRPVAPSPWRTVPPPQRFSTRIGCIQSAIDFREFSPTAAGFLLGPLSPVSWMRRVHSASSSLRERRIGTDNGLAQARLGRPLGARQRGRLHHADDAGRALCGAGAKCLRRALSAQHGNPNREERNSWGVTESNGASNLLSARCF
jgi:hypothetical protein